MGGNLFDAMDKLDFQKAKSKKGSSVLQIVSIAEQMSGSLETVKLV